MLWSVERPFAGAFAVHIPGATLRHHTGLVSAVLSASMNMANRQWRFSRNLGYPDPSPGGHGRRRGPADEPLTRGRAFGTDGSETSDAPPGIAKRRQRSAAKGRQGVAPRHTTVEDGELAPEEPVEGRAWPTGGSPGGNQAEHIEVPKPVTVTPRVSIRGLRSASWRHNDRIANPLVDEPDTLIGYVRICGSCGE